MADLPTSLVEPRSAPPLPEPAEAWADEFEDADDEPISRRRWRPTIRFFVLLALIVAGGLALTWQTKRPRPLVLEPPRLTPAIEQAILAAIAPGWPARTPLLPHPDGPLAATGGRVDGLAAADVDGDGLPEWGVAYTWLGPADATGARGTQPGFAVVQGGGIPTLLYEAAGAGGWEGPHGAMYTDADDGESHVEAVRLGPKEVGFLVHHTMETSRGGRMSVGRSRLFAPVLGQWGLSWEGLTESRQRAGHAQEVAYTAPARVEDVDGDGIAEVLLSPGHYVRKLDKGDRGVHFTTDGPGDWVYRRTGGSYYLAGLAHAHWARRPVTRGPVWPIRPAPPLYAVRAPRAITVDADFRDWEGEELGVLATAILDDASLIKYKRVEREGMEDCSGEVTLFWDPANLYLKAEIQDDMVVPGPAGRNMYKGDHLELWLDMNLERDFGLTARNGDDWQIGFGPGPLGGQGFCWVPKAGVQGVRVATRPMIDPYNGARRGYYLEAAIPWAMLGGPPGGSQLDGPPPGALPAELARTYHLKLAAIAGAALVLSDSDAQPQELTLVSNPGFVWAEPPTFNTLLLVERTP